MKKSLKIVLLGSLPKGDEERKLWKDWKTKYSEKLTKAIPNLKILHGDLISDNAGPELVVGHDLLLVKHADIAIVHAAEKIGAGTSQEIVLAKYFKIPVVSVIPKDTHHRRSNLVFHGVRIKDWIHPFLFVSSDYVAESLDDAIRWIQTYLKNPKQIAVKDMSVFEKAIKKFEEFIH